MKCNFTRIVIILLVMSAALSTRLQPARAQSPDGRWSEFVNISNTPTASTYPCIAADMAGNIHVLWSEDVGGKTKNLITNQDGTPAMDPRGNQINYLYDAGNSLFYTRWDGEGWSEPVDIQYNSTGNIEYPECVVDNLGTLHTVWVSSEGATAMLFYSRAPVEKAGITREWSQPVELASPILYSYYTVDIAVDIAGGLHILFAELGPGAGAYIINSFDNGNTWSAPIQLYSTFDERGDQEGLSPLKLISDKEGRLHATWTRYDVTGNGRAIYYAQSRDQGKTWTDPFEVAVWQPGWYEVDWLSVGILGDEIHLVWEGSSNVAAQVERISYDSGLTWSEPNYILPNLRGENGFADLVTDNADHLYMLIVKRGDSATLSHGIWYTSWEKGHWQVPILLGTTDSNLYSEANQLAVQSQQSLVDLLRGTFTGNGLRYQRYAIVNGNELHVIVVNEWDGDIWESHTTLDAHLIPSKPYPQQTPLPTSSYSPTIEVVDTLSPQASPLPDVATGDKNESPFTIILMGALPALILILGFITYKRIVRRE